MLFPILLGLGVGGFYVYKKHPEWLPAQLKPSAGNKAVALNKVVNASMNTTPHPTAGKDPGMTTAQVDAANQLIASSTDSKAMNALASDYSAKGLNNTATALITKANAVDAAKASQASDDELYKAMMTATDATHTQAAAMQAAGATVKVADDGAITTTSTTCG
jgi:hypothetical protein